MKILIGLFLSTMAFAISPQTANDDCSIGDFAGTWQGKVEYNGDELAQGPYEITAGANGEGLNLKDETGAEYVLEVDGCIATQILKEEGMDMTTTYTLEGGKLAMTSVVSFPDADGNMQKMEMKGSLSKVE